MFASSEHGNNTYQPCFVRFHVEEFEVQDQDFEYSLNYRFKLDLQEDGMAPQLANEEELCSKVDICEVGTSTDLVVTTTASKSREIHSVSRAILVRMGNTFISISEQLYAFLRAGAESVVNRTAGIGLHTCLQETLWFTVDRARYATEFYVITPLSVHGCSAGMCVDTQYLEGGASLLLLPRHERRLLARNDTQTAKTVFNAENMDGEIVQDSIEEASAVFQDSATSTPPAFALDSVCESCRAPFTLTKFRHHCRNCGGSYCGTHASKRRTLPYFGFYTAVRVCNSCAYLLEEEQQRQLLLWRQQRVNDYLSGQLRRYSHHEYDRSIDKAARVAQGTLQVLYAVPVLEPLRFLLGSMDVLCRHGLTGLTGFLLRHDFVEAADMLMRISGFEKFPISVGELTACLYYKLALDKGRRGRDPELEDRDHCSETHRIDNADYLAMSDSRPAEAMHAIAVHPYGEGNTASDADLDEAIRIAPLALCAVYQEQPADIQRLAGSQGWETLFVHADSKPEQPAFVLFARKQSSATDRGDCCHAVLCIRGTQTVQDVVTDIRAAPCSFPPDAEVVEHAWRGVTCQQPTSTTSVHVPVAAKAGAAEVGSTESTSGTADDWQWLDDSGTTTKACGGIGRASLWLLAQVGQSLQRLHASGYKITVAGHSLGGAVGSLLTLLLQERITGTHCWTYGSPCCVDKTLADQLKTCVTSVVLRDDAVSRFTPQSMRDMLRSLIASRSIVNSYLEQDWKDVVRRVTGWWTPRYRKIPQLSAAGCKPPAPLDPLGTRFTTAAAKEEGEEEGEEEFVLVEADVLLDLWLPGRVMHIYTHYGQCRASIVSRSYPPLRSIQVQTTMFEDHRSRSIFDALLEARAVRRSKENAPRWAGFSTSDECSCCANTFTWHSTFNSQAQGFRDRHNCRQCGQLCCGPCSEKRRSLPRIGILFPVRICDSCYYKGDYAL